MTEVELPPLEEDSPAPAKGRLSIGSIVLLVGVMLAVSVFGFALARRHQTQPTSGKAPDFTMTTYDGTEIRLSDLQGQIVFVNFWASWCIPCHEEAQDLQRVYERYHDRGVEFIGIAYTDTDTEALAYLNQYGITYPNAPDRGNTISDHYFIQGVPESFLINRDGNIVKTILQPTTETQLSGWLDDLLASET